MVSPAIKLYGTEEAEPDAVTLAAGPVTAVLHAGALRWIKLNDVEVLRSVAFTIRDHGWVTIDPWIKSLEIDDAGAVFEVNIEAACRMDGATLTWRGRIRGEPNGNLHFDATATTDGDVLTNRTGFVVLHPLAGVAGAPVDVTHVDGRTEHTSFPALVDPVQPITNIRALKHQVMPGVFATCTMEGESWETEDHRNWTDANFKTYSRLLDDPWPYTIAKGETVRQSVSLTFDGALPAAAGLAPAASVRIEIAAEPGGTTPRIGIGVLAQYAEAAIEAVDYLKRVAPHALIFEYAPCLGDAATVLTHHRELAAALGAEIVLHAVLANEADADTEARGIAADAAAAGFKPDAVVLTPRPHLMSLYPGFRRPPMPSFEELAAASRAAFPGATIGGGMHSFFTELNRSRPPTGLFDYVTHATCDIVHAADDRSVMETLAALPYIIRTTRSFMGDTPYRVGPSKIGMRRNPYGEDVTANPDGHRLTLAKIDPRQRGLFAAAWAVGYVAEMARGAVEVVSLCEPVGELGLLYRKGAHAQPWFDDAEDAVVYPIFHAVRGLARAGGKPLLPATSSRDGAVACLAFRRDDGTALWLANLTDGDQDVEIAGLPAAGEAHLHLLNEAAFEAATTHVNAFGDGAKPMDDRTRVALGPYVIARIDVLT